MPNSSTYRNTLSSLTHGLSTSVKVAIGVRASIGFLALLALVWFILHYRRSKLRHTQPSADDAENTRASELYSPIDIVLGRVSELYGQEEYELPGQHAGSCQGGTFVGTQSDQIVMDRLYEMEDQQYGAHQPFDNEGMSNKGGEQRSHETIQIHYHEM